MTYGRGMVRRAGGPFRAAVVVAAGLLAVAGCDVVTVPLDRRISVNSPAGSGSLYPGETITCQPSMHCDDLRAEVERWVAREMPDRGPVADISFHTFVDERGEGRLSMVRSGGGTWLAVVTLADGAQIGLSVGCGMGIDPKRCFASP
jgi:hypothetical protein